jgi:hypothetical protein
MGTNEETAMLTSTEEIRRDRDLVNEIDWEMTPEQAVRVYLEWGNIRARGDRTIVRSKTDYTVYFVVNCWSRPYYIYLIRRNSQEALELAKIELPKRFEKPVCELKGVYALEQDMKEWLKKELGAD